MSPKAQVVTAPKFALPVLIAAALCAGAAYAQAPARAPTMQALADCRAITDPQARLACYDKAAAAMIAAEAQGDLVTMDREQRRAMRRQAFGFNMPSFSLFDRGDRPEEVDRVTARVARAYLQGDGKWSLELEDGALWVQTESATLGRRPKDGSTVEIRKAAMGSYFINIDGQRAIRAKRVK